MKRTLLIALTMLFAGSTSCTTKQPSSTPHSGTNYADIQKAQRHVVLGKQFMKGMDFARAKEEFVKATNFDPTNENIWGLAATAAMYNSDFDKAIQYYRKVIEIQPNDFRAYGRIGEINYKLKRYDEAIASLKQALELNTEDFAAAAELARIYYDLRQYEECKSYINEFESILSRIKGDLLPDETKRKIEASRRQFAVYRKTISQ